MIQNRESDWISKDITIFIHQTVKEYTNFMSKPWQVSVMGNIIYNKKDIVVSVGTGSGNSLPYQLLFLIKKYAIVLVILPMIALIADQCQLLLDLNIAIVTLTAKTTNKDP